MHSKLIKAFFFFAVGLTMAGILVSLIAHFHSTSERITNVGHGVITLGISLAVAFSFIVFIANRRKTLMWMGLYWAVVLIFRCLIIIFHFPLNSLQQEAPPSGDASPTDIWTTPLNALQEAIITFAIVALFSFKRNTKKRIHLIKPSSLWEWIRNITFIIWAQLSIFFIMAGIVAGPQELVFYYTATFPILLLVLSNQPAQPKNDKWNHLIGF